MTFDEYVELRSLIDDHLFPDWRKNLDKNQGLVDFGSDCVAMRLHFIVERMYRGDQHMKEMMATAVPLKPPETP